MKIHRTATSEQKSNKPKTMLLSRRSGRNFTQSPDWVGHPSLPRARFTFAFPQSRLGSRNSGSAPTYLVLTVAVLALHITGIECQFGSMTQSSCSHLPPAFSNPAKGRCECVYRGSGFVQKLVKLNCTDTDFHRGDYGSLRVLPRSLESITLRGNNFWDLPKNIFGNCTGMNKPFTSLTYLDLSNNHIFTIQGQTFHCMPALEVLILDHNEWLVGNHNPRVFSSLRKLKKLHLVNTFEEFANKTERIKQLVQLSAIFNASMTYTIEELFLQKNELVGLSPKAFCALPGLKTLDLSQNSLDNIGLDASCTPKLENLYLNHNAMRSVYRNVLESFENFSNNGLKVLKLSDQNFKCDCYIKPFQMWLNTTASKMLVTDEKNVACSDPESFHRVQITSIDTEALVCLAPEPAGRNGRSSYIVIGCIFAILGVLAVAVLYLNRLKIKRLVQEHVLIPVGESFGGGSRFGYSTVSEAV